MKDLKWCCVVWCVDFCVGNFINIIYRHGIFPVLTRILFFNFCQDHFSVFLIYSKGFLLTLLNINDLYKLIFKYYYKIINNSVPEYYDTFLIRTESYKIYKLCNRPKLEPPFKHEFVKKSLKYQLYNIIDNESNTNVLSKAKTQSWRIYKLH